METIRVLLADNHTFLRKCIRLTLEDHGEIKVVGDTGNGEELLRLIPQTQPHIVVTDIVISGIDGLEMVERIKQQYPDIRVTILTEQVEEKYVLKALRAGVKGFVERSETTECVQHAIRIVAHGEVYFSPSVSRILADYLQRSTGPPDYPGRLTPREHEIDELLAAGHSVKEIAKRLQISRKTVYTHRANIVVRRGMHCNPGQIDK